MKTHIQASPPKSYSNAYGFTIKLEGNSLPQPCHPSGYFSVTGDIYHKSTRSRNGDGTRACGCLHDEALKAFPSLAFLVSLHLCDSETGAPSHTEENGFYKLAGACPEVSHFGQQYHSGNSKQNFPLKTPPPADKPWQTMEYRNPTPAECLQSLADFLRCPIEEAEAIRDHCIMTWYHTPAVPVSVQYPLNTAEHKKAIEQAEKDQYTTQSTATKAVFAKYIEGMRPRWAREAAQAHRQIAAIKLRRAGEKISEAINRANAAK